MNKTPGELLYERWRGAHEAPRYWDLPWRPRARWDALAREVDLPAASPYTAGGKRLTEGVSLQGKVVGPDPAAEPPAAPFSWSFDRLITGHAAGAGRGRDVTDEAATHLTDSLRAMAADPGLQEAFVAALDTADLRKAFVQAFFGHVVDDHLLFS